MVNNKLHSYGSIELCNNLSNKQCDGLGCENKGTHILLVALINRIGYFCENCKLDLERNDLVKHELSQSQFNLLGRMKGTKAT